jgi:hypothetical protein
MELSVAFPPDKGGIVIVGRYTALKNPAFRPYKRAAIMAQHPVKVVPTSAEKLTDERQLAGRIAGFPLVRAVQEKNA